jgi:hypothetical protein
MWLLRLLAVLTLLAVIVGVVAYLLTRNRWYLQSSWRLLRYAVIVALLVCSLLILERFALIAF